MNEETKQNMKMIGIVGGLILGVGSLLYVLDKKGMLEPQYKNTPTETIEEKVEEKPKYENYYPTGSIIKLIDHGNGRPAMLGLDTIGAADIEGAMIRDSYQRTSYDIKSTEEGIEKAGKHYKLAPGEEDALKNVWPKNE